jgi:hypothetical protein
VLHMKLSPRLIYVMSRRKLVITNVYGEKYHLSEVEIWSRYARKHLFSSDMIMGDTWIDQIIDRLSRLN